MIFQQDFPEQMGWGSGHERPDRKPPQPRPLPTALPQHGKIQSGWFQSQQFQNGQFQSQQFQNGQFQSRSSQSQLFQIELFRNG
jgi:hypothetical protein